jgi:hypothetical protein
MGYNPSTRILSVRLGPSHMSYPYTAHYLGTFSRFKDLREPRKRVPDNMNATLTVGSTTLAKASRQGPSTKNSLLDHPDFT